MSVVTSQSHYVAKLRPISADSLKGVPPETVVGAELAAQYKSLVGGLAWLLLTRCGVAAYVGFLQRNFVEPIAVHVTSANRLLRWLKRTEANVMYKRLPQPVRLVVAADNAF